MAIRIHVNKEDVQNAVREDPNFCMVAQAVRRQLQIEDTIEVDVDQSRILIGGYNGVDIPTPTPIADKITRWDKGTNVRPFEFDLDVPDDWRKQVAEGAAAAAAEEAEHDDQEEYVWDYA
jgi:hypothetical protein